MTQGEGLLAQLTFTGTVTSSSDSTLGGRTRFATGAVRDTLVGWIGLTTHIVRMRWKPRIKYRFKVSDITNSRSLMGFVGSTTQPTGDDPLNALNGFMFGKISTSGNWVIIRNDGTQASVVADTGILADINTHTIELIGDFANIRWGSSFDGGDVTWYTTEIPGATSLLAPFQNIRNYNTPTDQNIENFYTFINTDV